MLALVVALLIGSTGPARMDGLSGGELAGAARWPGAASPAVSEAVADPASARLLAIEPGHPPGHRVGALAGQGIGPLRRRAGRTWERVGSSERTRQHTGRIVDPSVRARCAARAAGTRRRAIFAVEACSSGPEEPEPDGSRSLAGLARSAPSPFPLLLLSRELV